MSRPPYPHRRHTGGETYSRCQCGDSITGEPLSSQAVVTVRPVYQPLGPAPETWGFGCRVAMEERIADLEARLDAAIERADVAEARCDALEERMTTADVPWRMPGCQCPVDSKPADRCDARWSRCNGRLQWLKALKAAGEGR